MNERPDASDLRHLDTWLDRHIDGDTRRAYLRARMLELAATDPEHWWSQSYWNWIDFGLPIDVRDVVNGKTEVPE
jgi:hypothetical protein